MKKSYRETYFLRWQIAKGKHISNKFSGKTWLSISLFIQFEASIRFFIESLYSIESISLVYSFIIKYVISIETI
jgi:hypothetical protein